MTREEEIQRKAEEIAESFRTARSFSRHPSDIAYSAAIEMAEFVDQHPRKGLWDSEKVIDWLNSWFTDDICKCDLPITKDARNTFFNDLRKAMEK